MPREPDPDFWVPCIECGNPPWDCRCGGTGQPDPDILREDRDERRRIEKETPDAG